MIKQTKLIKTIGVGIIILGVTIFAGCGKEDSQLNKAKDNMTAKIEKGKKMAKEGKGFMGGLKEAMKSGVVMKCVTNNEGGDWVTYIKDKDFKSEGKTPEGEEMITISKNEVIYTWEKNKKKGYKIDTKCMEDFQKDLGISNITNDFKIKKEFKFENLEKDEKDGKLKCTPSANVNFSVPKGIEFIDQCEMMKKQMSGMKKQIKQMQKIQQ